jgi:hypothetical protein
MRIMLLGFLLVQLNVFALISPIELKALAVAAAEEKSAQDRLHEAAGEYIQKHATGTEQDKWIARWNERVKTASASEESEEKFTQRTLQTFVEDNQRMFTEPETSEAAKLLECARIFCVCIQRKVEMPPRIASKLTSEAAQKLIEFMRR